ncbi:MAG TPA: hypothetical protein VMT16_14990 [Thermoanaerobaculia bacterium]|nr:hypothetical protein [Thermoanaerobaculia bacterium]
MIGALALAASVAGAVLLAGWLAGDSLLEERLALGLAVGPSLLAATSLVAALPLGVGPAAAVVGALPWAAAAWLAALRNERWRDVVAAARHLGWRLRYGGGAAMSLLFVAAGLAMILSVLLSQVLIERPDGALLTGTANNLGDMPLHLGLAHGFAYGDNLPPQSPIFAGHRLAYPFLPDFLSGLLIACGWGSGPALWVPAFLASAGFLVLLGALAYRAAGGALAAALAPLVFVAAGGGQVLFALRAILTAPAVDLAWAAQTLQATAQAWNVAWKNPLLALLVPQRTTAFGLALVTACLMLVWLALDGTQAPRPPSNVRVYAAAGVVAGLLPFVFTHGFLALAITLPLIWLGHWWSSARGWFVLGAVAAAVALPQLLWFAGGAEVERFLTWQPGWLAQGEAAPWYLRPFAFLWFWLGNLGPLLPLALLGLSLAGRLGLRRPRFWLAGWACFVLPSLVALAPWPWDNTKVYAVWLALAAVPAAALLARLLRGTWELRLLALGTAVWLGSASTVELAYALLRERDYEEYSAAAVTAAERLRVASRPGAVVAERPHWAQIALLAGRRSVMGYPGHLWSHGVDYSAREAELRQLYRSLAAAASGAGEDWRPVVDGTQVEFLVAGPEEERFCDCDLSRVEAVLGPPLAPGEIRVFDLGAPGAATAEHGVVR